VPGATLACERGTQLLQHAASELQPGSTIKLRTSSMQLAGESPVIHRLDGSLSALSAAAASWGLLRVAASELTVNCVCPPGRTQQADSACMRTQLYYDHAVIKP
jgi:hypothetical protein